MLGMLSEAPAPSQVKPSVFRRRNSSKSAYAALGAAASLVSLSPAADSGASPRAHNNYSPYQKVRARTRPGSAHRFPRPPFSSPCVFSAAFRAFSSLISPPGNLLLRKAQRRALGSSLTGAG